MRLRPTRQGPGNCAAGSTVGATAVRPAPGASLPLATLRLRSAHRAQHCVKPLGMHRIEEPLRLHGPRRPVHAASVRLPPRVRVRMNAAQGPPAQRPVAGSRAVEASHWPRCQASSSVQPWQPGRGVPSGYDEARRVQVQPAEAMTPRISHAKHPHPFSSHAACKSLATRSAAPGPPTRATSASTCWRTRSRTTFPAVDRLRSESFARLSTARGPCVCM